MPSVAWDIGMATASAVLLGAYHVWLLRQTRRKPLETSFGLGAQLRSCWVRMVMEQDRDILAVQTMRNWIMASSFLASTALLIALGVVNAAVNLESFTRSLHLLDVFGGRSELLWLVKLLLLTLTFFFAFFNFTLSIRYYNHASFAIVGQHARAMVVTPEDVAAIVNTGALHYSLGMRGFYLAIPLAMWLLGAVWLLVGAVAVTLALCALDRKL